MAIDHGNRANLEITAGQHDAVQEAMRIIIEDDRQRGVDPRAELACARCRRQRPMLGSLNYDDIRLCNACATGFEIARLGGRVRTCGEYVSSGGIRRHFP